MVGYQLAFFEFNLILPSLSLLSLPSLSLAFPQRVVNVIPRLASPRVMEMDGFFTEEEVDWLRMKAESLREKALLSNSQTQNLTYTLSNSHVSLSHALNLSHTRSLHLSLFFNLSNYFRLFL